MKDYTEGQRVFEYPCQRSAYHLLISYVIDLKAVIPKIQPTYKISYQNHILRVMCFQFYNTDVGWQN